jgi:2-polyprenyl-3-methyl-5-hydroxy-6-metoxy-1,4-benzoquinol methylase
MDQPDPVSSHNREAWDAQVERGNRWTLPVDHQAIEAARRGRLEVLLTDSRAVPAAWFPDLEGAEVLCLASGGGQQGSLLAAAGAKVSVLDNSPGQLAQDRLVAKRNRRCRLRRPSNTPFLGRYPSLAHPRARSTLGCQTIVHP